jgi:hypothetical protein
MTKTLAFLCVLLLSVQYTHASGGLLDRNISIDLQHTSLKIALIKIGELGAVQFSYNPSLIQEEKIVSLSFSNKPIRYALSLILDNSIRPKEVGNHIVLLANEFDENGKQRKKEEQTVFFTGKIIDAQTQLPLSGVSVYDIESRSAKLSNEKGWYKLEIEEIEAVRSLYIKKEGYTERVIVVKFDTNKRTINTNVSLEPIAMNKLPNTAVVKLNSDVAERAISGQLISQETYLNTLNLDLIEETRAAQISLVPSLGIGSNLSTNGLIINHFSLNVFSGYANGVRGAEIGGFVNLIRKDVIGAQVGGLANIVGKNVVGTQIAGLYNLNGGHFTGVQVAGLVSTCLKNLTGVQVCGVGGVVWGKMWGVQVSGITSVVKESFIGCQVAGVGATSFQKSKGFQLSGIYSSVYDTLDGGQVSGIVNFAHGGQHKIQLAGITNLGHENKGLQLAGIYNYAKINKGLQIGLINSSITSTGISVGLVNFVKNGYRALEVSATEGVQLNVTVKSGTRKFYNLYKIGYHLNETPALGVGLGFGSSFDFSDKASISCDAWYSFFFDADLKPFRFEQGVSFSPTFNYQLTKWMSIFGGPTLNLSVMRWTEDNSSLSSLVYNENNAVRIGSSGPNIMWLGGQVGLRF